MIRRGLLKGLLAMAFTGGDPGPTHGVNRPRASLPPQRLDQRYNPPDLPAVAPTSAGIERARIVLVFGPSGSLVGVFVYAAGTTPAAGNPPIAWMSNQSTDPFGNSLPSTTGVAGTGSFTAGNTIIKTSGVFTYSSLPPALGGLLESHGVKTAGTDNAGNAYLTGSTVYSSTTAIQHASVSGVPQISIYTAPGPGGPWTQQASAQILNGTFNYIGPSTNLPAITINGIGFGLSPAPPATFGQVNLYSPDGVQLIAQEQNGFTGTLPREQTSSATHSNVNQAGATTITDTWTIPAGSMQLNSVYEIEVPFDGTFENQTLTFGISIDGSATILAQSLIGASFFSAGQGFNGEITVKMQVTATGPGGNVKCFSKGGLGITGTRSSGVNNNDAYLSGRDLAVPLDTTIAHNIRVNTLWGATSAGQTLTGYGSTFRKSGP